VLTLVRTELAALGTIRGPWLLVAASIIATAVPALMHVIDAGDRGAPSIGTAGAMLAVLDAAGNARIIALLLGVLTITAEFRHNTVTVMFLHLPRRSRVVLAKAATVVLVGVAVGVIDLAVALAVGVPSGAVPWSLLNGDIALHALGQALTYPLYALLGLGIGTLLINQPLAVVLPLTWLLVVEGLVVDLLPHGSDRWGLAGVTAALSYAPDGIVLPMLVGGLTLAAYALLLSSLGTARVARCDIT
jgi:hypothetical protein